MNSNRTSVRSLAAGLALAAATTLAAAQTLCGTWEPLVDDLLGDIGSVETRVSDLIVFDAGDGPMLYMAGNFEVVVDPVFGEVRAPGLARFDGERWSAVPGLDGPGLELDMRAISLEVFDDGSGPALFVGGEFTTAGGQAATGIARWDGAEWSGLDGPGVPGGATRVFEIHFHDFGDGPMLYAGGVMFAGPGEPSNYLLRWDGVRWSRPGDGQPFDDEVIDLASYGGDLFVSGRFQRIGDEPVSGIARFDGMTWESPVGPDQAVNGQHFWALLPTERDGREVLVAGGQFRVDEGGTRIAANLAAWDGRRWESLTASPAESISSLTSLASFDDGSGPAVFVAGSSVVPFTNVARLRDGVLLPMRPLAVDLVYDLFVYDDGTGPVLLAGGKSHSPGTGVPFVARWMPGALCPADMTADCVVERVDFHIFQNFFDRGDLRADFDGDGSLTIFDFLAFQNAFDAGC